MGIPTLTVQNAPGTQPEEPSEGECMERNEESGCGEKDEGVPEVVSATNFTFKETSQIFYIIKRAKDEI